MKLVKSMKFQKTTVLILRKIKVLLKDYVDPKDDGEIPDDIINTTEKNQATFGLSFRSQEKVSWKYHCISERIIQYPLKSRGRNRLSISEAKTCTK